MKLHIGRNKRRHKGVLWKKLKLERLELERSKIEEMERRNNLLEERHRFLKEHFAKDHLSELLI